MNASRLREQLIEELNEAIAALAEYEAINPSAWDEARTHEALREIHRIASAAGIETPNVHEWLNKDGAPVKLSNKA